MANSKRYYKDPRHGNVYGYIVATPPGRLIFPQLVEPGEGYEYEGRQVDGKYEATILLDAKSKETKEFIEEIVQQAEVMQEMYNDTGKKKGKKKKVTVDIDFDQIFLHAEDADWVDMEQYPYYKDTIILKATFKSQPVARGAKIEDFEGGMVVQLGVNPLITSNGGVTFQLKLIKFVEDDDQRFGGGGFNLNKEADRVFGEALEGEEDSDSVDEDEELEESYAKEADKFLGKGKKSKKKAVEEDEEDDESDDEDDQEDDAEESDADESDDSDDDESDDEGEEDSDEDDDSDNSDSDDEDEEDDDSGDDDDSDEDEEEEEEPVTKRAPGKKATPEVKPEKRLTAQDIRARAVASRKEKEAAGKSSKTVVKASSKKSAIDRL